MHTGEAIPRVTLDTPLTEALHEMSSKGLGMTAVVDQDGRVAGIFTGGDLRRTLDQKLDFHCHQVGDVMTRHCTTIRTGVLAAEALAVMDAKKINGLLVVDQEQKLVGAVGMHDLLRAGVV